MIILDTDTVTHFSYGKESVRRKIEEVRENEPLAVTVITWMEILRGRADSFRKAANEDQLTKAMERFRLAEAMLATFQIIALDEDAVKHFGRLRKDNKLNKDGASGSAHSLYRLGAR